MFNPVELVNPLAVADLVITVDHAGNFVPPELENLGLPQAELSRHIGWDIGAAGLARAVARRLKAPAVLARVSRLVIDPNRPLGDPDSVPCVSDGSPVPGNRNLSAAELAARADLFFHPYHRAVEREIERLRRAGRTPAVLSLHSFTPRLSAAGAPRPWHIGVMYSYDRALASHLISAFGAGKDVVVGDNEPYSGFIHGYALKRHGLAQNLPHAQLEVRQDLLSDDGGQERWAEAIAGAMAAWMDGSIQKVSHG